MFKINQPTGHTGPTLSSTIAAGQVSDPWGGVILYTEFISRQLLLIPQFPTLPTFVKLKRILGKISIEILLTFKKF